MTSFVTNAGSAHVLAILFGRTELALPDHFLALCHKLPNLGDDGSTIDEPDPAQGYQRVQYANYQNNWLLSGYNEAINVNDILWPVVAGDWGALTAFGILDSPTIGTGRLFYCGTLNPPLQPAVLTQLRVRAGQLVVNVASITPSYQPT
jgi:hypothetical protein